MLRRTLHAMSRIDHYVTRTTLQQPIFNRIHPVVYSSKPGPLAEPQLQSFDNNGFIVIPNLFSPKEIQTFKAIRDDYHKTFLNNTQLKVTSNVPVATEPGNDQSIRSVFAVHQSSPVIQQLSQDPRLVDVAKQILDDNVYIHQSRINFQPALTGTGFYWHSDFETWHAEDGLPIPRCLSAVVMLDQNIPQNGCLMVIPGSHKYFVPCPGETPPENWEQSLTHQEVGTPPAEVLEEMCNNLGLTHCTGKPGSVLFFDSNLLHASTNNMSPWPRTNCFFVYNALSNAPSQPYNTPEWRPEHVATRVPEPIN